MSLKYSICSFDGNDYVGPGDFDLSIRLVGGIESKVRLASSFTLVATSYTMIIALALCYA